MMPTMQMNNTTATSHPPVTPNRFITSPASFKLPLRHHSE